VMRWMGWLLRCIAEGSASSHRLDARRDNLSGLVVAASSALRRRSRCRRRRSERRVRRDGLPPRRGDGSGCVASRVRQRLLALW
jgi:hypothetical protein